jgi:plasmid replication initiation protein
MESKDKVIKKPKYTPNANVKQSRDLVSAIYDLNIKQKRLVYLAIREAAHDKIQRSDAGSIVCNINVRDYAYFFNMSSQQASREVSGAIKSMAGKEVAFLDPKEDYDADTAVDFVPWFSRRSIKCKTGVYRVFINTEIEEHIRGLNTRYMYLSLLDVAEFSNPYIGRIFEHLRMHNTAKHGETGEVWINIKFMLNRFKMPKSYQRMPDLKRRVLDPACKLITENTSYKLLDKDGNSTYSVIVAPNTKTPEVIVFKYIYLNPVAKELGLEDVLG